MRRVDRPEILDSDACSAEEVEAALAVIGRINRRFGGVSTSQKLVEQAARDAGLDRVSVLEVGAGTGDVPETVRHNLAQCGLMLDITLLDRARSHLPSRGHSIVADALKIPFADGSFDMVACNLFAHHLSPEQLRCFVNDALRVCRHAVLINDLVRHPIHLALVFASFPLMRSRVAWVDGLTSVRRAYTPLEIRRMVEDQLVAPVRVHIFRQYLFRMGVTIWKSNVEKTN
jgi:SAM-dependent methyltransferase